MKIPFKFSVLVLLLSACGPLNPSTPEPALTPGRYKYQDFAYYMTFSPDDSLLALTTLTGLYVYNAKTHEQLAAFEKPSGSTVTFGSKYMAAITNDGVFAWDLSVHTQLFEFTTPIVTGDGWHCGAINSDGSVLAASNNEGYIYFYDMTSGEKTGEIFLPYKFIVEKG